MKGSCTLMASMLAASTVALTSSASSCSSYDADRNLAFSTSKSTKGFSNGKRASIAKTGSSPPEKFAPRFDGLRFIETLVTAHR